MLRMRARRACPRRLDAARPHALRAVSRCAHHACKDTGVESLNRRPAFRVDTALSLASAVPTGARSSTVRMPVRAMCTRTRTARTQAPCLASRAPYLYTRHACARVPY
eukprot:6213092-Pleurochrysis_carterae.AAC.2